MTYGRYLKRNRSGTLCFRAIIPSDVREVFGRREVNVSLGNRGRADAVRVARELGAIVQRLIHSARSMGEKKTLKIHELSPETVKTLLLVAIRKEEIRQAEASEEEEKASDAIAEVETLRSIIGHLKRPVAAVPSAVVGPPVSEAVAAYTAECLAAKRWKPKSAAKFGAHFALLVDWFGDATVNSIGRTQMIEFFEAVQRLPSNASKKKQFKGLRMRELAASGAADCIAKATINQTMTTVSALWAWMADEPGKWGVDGNVARGLTVVRGKQTRRDVFTDDDMRLLFTAAEWRERAFLHSYAYWLPLLGAFTGARIDELARLELRDFDEIGGAPFVRICAYRAAAVDQPGKTDNAERSMPLHPMLVKLGLLRHVDRLRQRGERRLFPELIERRDGFGQDASRWFTRFKRRAGITDSAKVFHSWRHTVNSRLLAAGADRETEVEPLIGHSGESVSTRVYMHLDVPQLSAIVGLLNYPVITELVPEVEKVVFGVDVHRKARRPPLRKRTSTRAAASRR